MRPITLQRLDVFRAVYEQGSISAAARELKLTQPTVSKHLRDFESAIGITLFALDKGRLHPTVDGDALFVECRHIKDSLVRLEGRIDSLRHGSLRTLEVQVIAPLMHDCLPRAIKVARDEVPGLKLAIDVANAEEQFRAMRAGRIDLGLVAGPLPPLDFHVERLGTGRLLLLMPENHPLTQNKEITRTQAQAACGSIRLSTAGTIGGLVMENIGYSTAPDAAAMTIRSLNLAAGLSSHLNSAVVVDNFTADLARLRGLATRPIVPEITFGIYAVSNPQTVRSKASEVLLRAIKHSLSKG
ncbi:LysR family transcriptional regulator [Marinovum sp. 2_MG-2023]|uniref:LysR family transcriptional regulator n=1 Tax=unclassified Marinovum TaxID=2647166 RepID=UPI0026E1E22D|nr:MULTISPECIES: LysR family transcriptional regulator [unclassified Marinovum]MDO6732581.1 LysR family transcriptional regulator [Marinovum sp. 2_MG-2023]MDO6782052.1 LysR family transcriptional regulator [Marinovum sp. 1_MG-2023]